MPHSAPDPSKRAQPSQLPELMDEPCSREELRDCLRELARVNRWFLGYRPVLDWLQSFNFVSGSEELRILDVACGYGDGLRRIERWAAERNIRVALTGLDLNPASTAIAAEASGAESSIQWISADVFSYEMQRPAHLVVSSLFTHHLEDADVIRFLQWMEQNAEVGWFINDLSRAAIPYHLFRMFSKLAGLHPFVQHDGPVSFARSFVPDDWRRLCTAAGLKFSDITIRGYTPGRLCVSRRKPR
jgi:2-polyprenyl-3-methyl-5-hydroxy-6-metoxy-1,4-benzoquinol methylase